MISLNAGSIVAVALWSPNADLQKGSTARSLPRTAIRGDYGTSERIRWGRGGCEERKKF